MGDTWHLIQNNTWWREDGAVVTYDLDDIEFSAHHPGGVVRNNDNGGIQFGSAEVAKAAVDEQYPLLRITFDKKRENPDPGGFHINPNFLPKTPKAGVDRVIDALKRRPNLLLDLLDKLPSVAQKVLRPWERTTNFGGSIVRCRAGDDLATPTARVVQRESQWAAEGAGGSAGRVGGWTLDVFPTAREAMDALDEVFTEHFILALGRPTAGDWVLDDEGEHHRPELFPAKDGRSVGRIRWEGRKWAWGSWGLDGQTMGGSASTLVSAQKHCDRDLVSNGWFLYGRADCSVCKGAVLNQPCPMPTCRLGFVDAQIAAEAG